MVIGRTSPRGGSVTINLPTAQAFAAALAPTITVEQPSTVSVNYEVIPGQRRRVTLDATALAWLGFAEGLKLAYDMLAPVVGPFEAMLLVITIAATVAQRPPPGD
jgi:hypothetical protein